jgi:hypothetical protein
MNTPMVILVLFKPKKLFFGGLVDPATEVLFRFAFLPKKAFRFTPSAISPSHVVDFDLLRF